MGVWEQRDVSAYTKVIPQIDPTSGTQFRVLHFVHTCIKSLVSVLNGHSHADFVHLGRHMVVSEVRWVLVS